MIFVDHLFKCVAQGTQARRVGARNGHQWCHLFCERGNEKELHALAKSIGMKRAWFQSKSIFPHYDLTPAKRKLAIRNGAFPISLKTYIKLKRSLGELW